MLVLRNNTVWVGTPGQLTAQRAEIAIGALSCHTESNGNVPPLRSSLTLDLMLNGQRHGPMQAEVVYCAGQLIGLQLSPTSVELLLDLCDAQTNRSPASTAALTAAARRQRPMSESGPIAVDAVRILPTGELPPLTQIQPLSGTFAGSIAIGALRYLLGSKPIPAPAALGSPLQLLRYLCDHKATGKLVVVHGENTKTIWWRGGVALKVVSHPPKEEESLGQLLLKAKLITPHKLADVIRRSRNTHVPLGLATIEAEVVDATQLKQLLIHQTYCRLQDLTTWDGAVFTFTPSAVAQGDYHPVSVPRLFCQLANDILRNTLTEDLSTLLDPYLDQYGTVLDPDDERFRFAIPDEKVRRVCQQILNGTLSLRQSLTASQLGRPKTIRTIYYLHGASLLTFSVEPRLSQLTISALQEHFRAITLQDHFQRLGIEYACTKDQIVTAAHTISSRYQPGSAWHRVDATLCQQIRDSIEQSRQVLIDTAKRTAYRAQLLGPGKLGPWRHRIADELQLCRVMGLSAVGDELQDMAAEL